MKIKQKDTSTLYCIDKLKKILTDIEVILVDLNFDSLKLKNTTDNKILETKILLSANSNSVIFINLIVDEYNDIFDKFYSSYGFDKSPEIEKEIIRLDRFRNSLGYIIDYLSITDSLNGSENEVFHESIIDKSEFLLTQLNKLFNDKTYSISIIFKLSKVNFRDGEPREIAEYLSQRGYLILKDKYRESSDYAKISVKGASYIERINKSKNIKRNKQDINSKINQITVLLTKLGYGQEVIFNEIYEIKDLYSKLNKKNWIELVKGKLIDLGLSQIINKEVISEIYEILVEDKLKLTK